MKDSFDVVVLSAELQAAVSAALSRPDLRFLFLSERDLIDGWDLPNVTIRRGNQPQLMACAETVPRRLVLSPAWLPSLGFATRSFCLSNVMPLILSAFPGLVLPVFPAALDRPWILKGDAWHRPDAPVQGETGDPGDWDSHPCGAVYQERLRAADSLVAAGRRDGPGHCILGIIDVHQEAFAREDFLIAGESVADAEIEAQTRAVLDVLDQHGYFAINWIRDTHGQAFITSFRPVPRALFQLFRFGGLDLLEPAPGNFTLPPGGRFVVEYNYASYQ